jgi:hypothetical protein
VVECGCVANALACRRWRCGAAGGNLKRWPRVLPRASSSASRRAIPQMRRRSSGSDSSRRTSGASRFQGPPPLSTGRASPTTCLLRVRAVFPASAVVFPHAIDSRPAPLFGVAMRKLDTPLAAPLREDAQVFCWRLERSHDLGFDPRLANRVAASQIDLHQLECLISSGCRPGTAYRILRP